MARLPRVFWVSWLALSSCSWSRFDDVSENSPVVRFDSPKAVIGIGSALSTAQSSDGAWLLAAGHESTSLYSLGRDESPARGALRVVDCSSSDGCWLAAHLAGLGITTDDGTLACFAYALGASGDAQGRLMLQCEDGTRPIFEVPPSVGDSGVLGTANRDLRVELTSGAAFSGDALLAALPDVPLVWWYPTSNSSPLEISVPQDAQSGFGASLGLMRGPNGGWLLSVGEPDAARIWLFSATSTDSTLVGCLSGPEGFGRTQTVGEFDELTGDDLAVSDADRAYVISSNGLSDRAAAAPTQCVDIGDLPFLAELACAERDEVRDCANGDFGTAMSSADLDDDGRDEILVGAPGLEVQGKHNAGAVAVFGHLDNDFVLADYFRVSTAESGDRLGSSVAPVALSRPDAVVVGAPGKNRLFGFYCSELWPSDLDSPRCH